MPFLYTGRVDGGKPFNETEEIVSFVKVDESNVRICIL